MEHIFVSVPDAAKLEFLTRIFKELSLDYVSYAPKNLSEDPKAFFSQKLNRADLVDRARQAELEIESGLGTSIQELKR